ncbi:histidine phosphatase family protein [Brevibacterium album]|uniref:histidine phosphatase family protein n=1 Tax=Brevibacterium album TaxID=417948 RepID=UPI00041681B3|nr:histidine phosphatase family protein [Brevibacterium album]
MSTRLILLRHAETEANVRRVVDTRPPGAPLTALGRDQADEFAGYAQSLACRALVTSTALRAQQTADSIARALGIPARVADGLHEVQAGDFEGRTDETAIQAYYDLFAAWMRGEYDRKLPGGETGHEVLERYLPVIEDLRRHHFEVAGATEASGTGARTGTGADVPAEAAGTVVIVSHGAVIRFIASHLTGFHAGLASAERMPNTGGIELIPSDTGWEPLRWGHLLPPGDGDRAQPHPAAEAARAMG